MAIGDFAPSNTVQINVTVQVGVTFPCPNCATVNTTPQQNKAGTLGTNDTVTLYASYPCSNCGKRMLISLQVEGFRAQVQQAT